jgi:tetratricopeptide (TPR) repeat protein
VRNAEFEPPEAILEGMPEQLYQIINRALARDREQRYQSCAEMYEDIEECLASFSSRPNAAGLSKYMKSLFTEEIATETRSLKDVSRIIQVSDTAPEPGWAAKLDRLRGSLSQIPAGLKRLWSPLKEKVAAISATGKEKASQQPKLWIGIASGGALALVLVLGLVLFRGSGSAPDQNKTEHPPAAASSSGQDSPTPDSSVESTLAAVPSLKQATRALENEDYVLAVKLFQEALKQNPSLLKDIAAPYARALRGQGSTLIEKKPKEAQSLLQKAVEIDPHTAENHFQLGLLFVKLKKYPEAIKSYRKAGGLNPKSPETFFNLGFVYAITKDYENAEKMFRRVTELKPPYLDEAYSNLAVIQEKQGKRQEAIKSLQQALEVNPNNQKARKYLDRFKG